MADIDLERTRGRSAWGWLVGAFVVALLAWGAVELMDAGEPELAEVRVTDEPEQERAGGAHMRAGEDEMEARARGMGMEGGEGRSTITEALIHPQGWVSRSLPQATVPVVEVPTDRGFWVSTRAGRLFVILIDQPREEPKDVNAGATVRLTGGTFRDADHLSQLEGGPLDEETRQTARDQAIFLVVDERNVEIVQQAPDPR